MMGRLFGGPQAVTALGTAAREVAEVFTPSATRRMELSAEAQRFALDQHGAEFAHARPGWFDAMVNGLNRLPRPMLALGTLGLFVYAMAEPDGFAHRMQGLAHVPEPLWWLLGAIVAFYFGARETNYFRVRTPATAALAAGGGPAVADVAVADAAVADVAVADAAAEAGQPAGAAPNPALVDWLGSNPGQR